MPGFTVEQELLLIESSGGPPSSLASHLQEPSLYLQDMTHFNSRMNQQCKQFFEKTDGQSITTLKFNDWNENYQAIFLGVINKRCPNIEQIDLSDCLIRDADIPFIITMLRRCDNIRHIKLNNNYISNEGALSLLKTILELGTIETLDLSNNDIGHQTCLFFEEQIALFTKTKLNLEKNQHPDEIIPKDKKDPEKIVRLKRYLGELAEEFQPGDLLYGLDAGLPEDKGRNPVEAALKEVLAKQANHQLLIINPFSDWVINKNDYEGACKKELVIFDDFIHKISTSIYPDDDRPFFRGWSEHKMLCKLGILWAKKNDKKIHYVLDEINMSQFASGHRNRADTSVTEAEIKFIASFYEHLKDNVVFWRTDETTGNLIKAQAPWLDPATKHHWEPIMKAKEREMQFFPKGQLSKNEFFQVIKKREAYRVLASHKALESLFSDVIEKSPNPEIQLLVGKYLAELLEADTKFKLEKWVFSLAVEYKELHASTNDEALEHVLENIVKESKKRSDAPEHERFFYRTKFFERIFGNRVFDTTSLFKLADELDKAKQLIDKPPSFHMK
jgi:hypothetical protein